MSDLIDRLRQNADAHRDVAHGCDCRPEDTVNWQHGLDDDAAADRIAELEAALRDANRMIGDIVMGHGRDGELLISNLTRQKYWDFRLECEETHDGTVVRAFPV